jgi:hypothetical protein
VGIYMTFYYCPWTCSIKPSLQYFHITSKFCRFRWLLKFPFHLFKINYIAHLMWVIRHDILNNKKDASAFQIQKMWLKCYILFIINYYLVWRR